MQKPISPKIPPRLDANEHAATALHFIARFGWLRAIELGRFVYPNDAHGRKYSEKLLRKLVQLRYVLPRKLPGVGAGTAYVVAARGAAWLNANAVGSNARNAHTEEDDYYRDGTNWGRSDKNGVWSPPLSWEHDLLATGVLSLFWQQGAEDVVSERELLRMVPNVKDNKHADGLAVTKDPHGRLQTVWLEVERSRKSGENLDAMLKAIVTAQRSTPVTNYPGLPPVKHGMIAVPELCRDERGYSLNHQQRILNRLAKVGVKSDTNIHFVLMELKHVTVESIRFATIVAKANSTANEQAHAQADEEAHEEANDMEYREANARGASEQTDSVAYEHNEAQPTQDGDRATLETTGLTGRVWQFVKAKVTSAN
jgi:hypothetical protein